MSASECKRYVARARRLIVAVAIAGGALVILGDAASAAPDGSAAIFAPAPIGPQTPSAAAAANIEAEFFGDVNSQRASAGRAALLRRGGLDDVARSWTAQMSSRNDLGHNPRLREHVDAVEPNWWSVGENVGVGHDVQALSDAFWNSPGHHKNIVGVYTDVGIGALVEEDGKIWITFVFVEVRDSNPTPTSPPPSPSTTAQPTTAPPATAPPTTGPPATPAPTPTPSAAASSNLPPASTAPASTSAPASPTVSTAGDDVGPDERSRGIPSSPPPSSTGGARGTQAVGIDTAPALAVAGVSVAGSKAGGVPHPMFGITCIDPATGFAIDGIYCGDVGLAASAAHDLAIAVATAVSITRG